MNLLDALLPPDAGPTGQLSIYLNDHRAGAEGAEALAERCARSNADNAVGRYLTDHFLPELRDDRALLETVRERLDVRDNPFKQWAARLGELVGRTKANGAVTGYMGLSRVLELEALISGVAAKRQLWRGLTTVSDADTYDARIARADEQIERLTSLHLWASEQAFLEDASERGDGGHDGDGPNGRAT